MLLAQLSDTHVLEPGAVLCGVVDTAALLAAAVAHVNALEPSPDFVLVTGDLVDDGSQAQYAHLRQLLAPLRAPVILVPGNHDDPAALLAEFPDQRGRAVHDLGPLRLVVLDSRLPGQPGGCLGEEQLRWLDEVLATDRGRPALVAVHHPPFVTGIVHMDGMGLQDAEAFGEVIARHPHVERVLSGHLHRPIQVRWRGTLALTAPSVAHQVSLDLRPDGTATFTFEPAAILLHWWRHDAGLVTHQSYVERFAGPYRFDGSRVE